MRVRARFEFKLQDMWVGVFWKTAYCETGIELIPYATDIWVCVLPCVPLHMTVHHKIVF